MSQELIVLVGMQGPMQSFEHRISTISSAYLSGGSSQKALESWQKRNIFRSYLRARNGVVSSWFLFSFSSRQWGGKQWIALENNKFEGSWWQITKLTVKNSPGFSEILQTAFSKSYSWQGVHLLGHKAKLWRGGTSQQMGKLSSWFITPGLGCRPAKLVLSMAVIGVQNQACENFWLLQETCKYWAASASGVTNLLCRSVVLA